MILARHGMSNIRGWYVPTIVSQSGDLPALHKSITVVRAHNIPFLRMERVNTPGTGTWFLNLNQFPPSFDFSMLLFVPASADRKAGGIKLNGYAAAQPYDGLGYWSDQHVSNWNLRDHGSSVYDGSGGFPFYILLVMKNNECKLYQGNDPTDFSTGWTLRYTDPSNWATATTIRCGMSIGIDAGADNYIRSSLIDKAVI